MRVFSLWKISFCKQEGKVCLYFHEPKVIFKPIGAQIQPANSFDPPYTFLETDIKEPEDTPLPWCTPILFQRGRSPNFKGRYCPSQHSPPPICCIYNTASMQKKHPNLPIFCKTESKKFLGANEFFIYDKCLIMVEIKICLISKL